MKLRHGVRFVNLTEGTIWELRTQGQDGLWACRAIQPMCTAQECPNRIFVEFAEEEIRQHVVLEPLSFKATHVKQAELEMMHIIDTAAAQLSLLQQRALYRALSESVRSRFELVCLRLGVSPDES